MDAALAYCTYSTACKDSASFRLLNGRLQDRPLFFLHIFYAISSLNSINSNPSGNRGETAQICIIGSITNIDD